MMSPNRNPRPSPTKSVVLFDGVCNLCNATVNFIIDRDPDGFFRFAPLQSDVAEAYVDEFDEASLHAGTIVLYEDGEIYTRSTAALRIARRLSGAWPLLFLAIVVPRAVRDAVYDWIATNRYDWFGQRDRCRRPTPELKDRFLEYEAPES